MKEEDFYFEDVIPSKVKIICIIILLLGVVGTLIYMYYHKNHTINIKSKVVYEIGEILSDNVEDYLINKVSDPEDYTLIITNIPTNNDILETIGKFTYKIKYRNITKKGTIVVEDTTGPKVETKDLKIGINENYELDDFIVSCDDYSKPCIVNYKNNNDAKLSNKAGTYAFDIVVEDQYKNKTTKTVRLDVIEGYSLEDEKKKDLTVDHMSITYDDWKGQMIIKYSEGINENNLDEDEKYMELLEVAASDIRSYLPETYMYNRIDKEEIIFLYNKYNYVVGFAIRVTLDNGLSLYLQK